MKRSAMLIVMCTILGGISSYGMSEVPPGPQNLTCKISTPETKGCTGIPTLQSGRLTISKDGTFQLQGHYDGCFFIEDVTATGKYRATQFKNTMSLELLSTRTTGVKDTAKEFPRTLGFANLNAGNRTGYFVDISAVIRGRGRDTKNVITSTLQCDMYE